MLFVHQAGEDQPLPVPVQRVLTAYRVVNHAASGRQRRQQQVYLGIVAQRLKMPDALHGIGNGFAVQDLPLVESDVHVKALAHQVPEDLGLHFTHKAHMDAALPAVPLQMQLGVLLLQLQELRIKRGGVDVSREDQPVGQHRFQYRLGGLFRHTQRLARIAGTQPEDGGDLPGRNAIGRLVLFSGVQTQLRQLFLMRCSVLIGILQRFPHPQAPAGHLQKGQTVSLRVARDLEDLRAEGFRGRCARGQRNQRVEQFLHPVQAQPGTKEAGEQRTLRNHLRKQRIVNRFPLQEAVHGSLTAQGDLLVKIGSTLRKVHAAAVEAGAQFLHQGVFVRPGEVHLRDEQEGRNPMPLQQPPERFGVGLYTIAAGNHQHRAVQYGESALHFGREVYMPRRVEQGDGGIRPVQHGLFGEDGDAALTFQAVSIEEAAAVVDPPQLLHRAGEIEHRLGQRGFAGVHMGDKADAEVSLRRLR